MTDTDRRCMRLHPDDSVVVAVKALGRGQKLPEENAVLLDDIPAGRKTDTSRGAVINYGQVIGFATTGIAGPAGSQRLAGSPPALFQPPNSEFLRDGLRRGRPTAGLGRKGLACRNRCHLVWILFS